MRSLVVLLGALPLTACGASNDAAAAALACPSQLTAPTSLPQGFRLIGKVDAPMLLWDAEVGTGLVAHVEADRVISPADRDNEDEGGLTRLPNGNVLARYSTELQRTEVPGEFQRYMLVCRYGVDGPAAIDQGPRSAMLLIPLPYKALVQCEVLTAKRGANGLRKPLIAAA